jgi:hypothetical protein
MNEPGPGEETIVIADQPIGGGGGGTVITRPTLAEKDTYGDIATLLTVSGIAFGAASGISALAGPELWGVSAIAIMAAAATGIGAAGFDILAKNHRSPISANRSESPASGSPPTRYPRRTSPLRSHGSMFSMI